MWLLNLRILPTFLSMGNVVENSHISIFPQCNRQLFDVLPLTTSKIYHTFHPHFVHQSSQGPPERPICNMMTIRAIPHSVGHDLASWDRNLPKYEMRCSTKIFTCFCNSRLLVMAFVSFKTEFLGLVAWYPNIVPSNGKKSIPCQEQQYHYLKWMPSWWADHDSSFNFSTDDSTEIFWL